jgi:hypothetical protein
MIIRTELFSSCHYYFSILEEPNAGLNSHEKNNQQKPMELVLVCL